MSTIYYETTDGDSSEMESVAQARGDLEAEGKVVCETADDYGPDGKRWLVWASEEDAENDAGAKAVGQIVEVEVEEESELLEHMRDRYLG